MRAGGERQRGRAPEVVVIGGSAGGLDAVIQLLGALPADMTLPIVIVLHLARHQPSRLAEVLASSVGRRVEEAQDKAPLSNGAIYVAPPDYHLLLDTGPSLALSVEGPVNYSLPSIDVLFESAADIFGPRVVGVLLSGANEDGARGLHAIVDAGGQAMIQSPEEAATAAMPKAGLQLTPEVTQLPVREIGERLGRIAGNPGGVQ